MVPAAAAVVAGVDLQPFIGLGCAQPEQDQDAHRQRGADGELSPAQCFQESMRVEREKWWAHQ